ncbi:MAG: DUF4159 domain-containing protein [Marinagarivorans sp.]|nr:DUF4159 domain-containing protein [Marinagarivorans sp.]
MSTRTIKPTSSHVRARARYSSRGRRGGWGRSERWATDYPDSDLNFSFRLQRLTSLKVNPDGLVLELDDPRIFDYPFLYLIEPGDHLHPTPIL